VANAGRPSVCVACRDGIAAVTLQRPMQVGCQVLKRHAGPGTRALPTPCLPRCLRPCSRALPEDLCRPHAVQPGQRGAGVWEAANRARLTLSNQRSSGWPRCALWGTVNSFLCACSHAPRRQGCTEDTGLAGRATNPNARHSLCAGPGLDGQRPGAPGWLGGWRARHQAPTQPAGAQLVVCSPGLSQLLTRGTRMHP